MSITISFGQACRTSRHRLDITQQQLGDAVGLSRGYIARIECGTANPTMHQVEQISEALGLQLSLLAAPLVFLHERQPHDLVHARCSSYVERRFERAAWRVMREVDASRDRVHAWIDLLAFDPRTGTLLIIEVKTRLDDMGGLERQLGWYERHARRVADSLGWRPRIVGTWVLALASAEVEASLVANRRTIERMLPGRAAHMSAVARGEVLPVRRAIALIDPTSRRRDWLMRSRLEGRRGPAPFTGYADAAQRLRTREA